MGRLHCQGRSTYEYFFHPLNGKPQEIDRSAAPIPITVRTEQLFCKKEHDVFFNRGVASSQAYARRFHNEPPDSSRQRKERRGTPVAHS